MTNQTTITIRVQAEDFSVAEEYEKMLTHDSGQCGAVTLFVGKVRDWQKDHESEASVNAVHSLSLEHYSGMTEKTLHAMVDEACTRWPLLAVHIIHRVGTLKPCDQIVLVGVASAHRADAFSACEMLMDYLKTKAPFWKKVHDGARESWVSANEEDNARQARW